MWKAFLHVFYGCRLSVVSYQLSVSPTDNQNWQRSIKFAFKSEHTAILVKENKVHQHSQKIGQILLIILLKGRYLPSKKLV